MSLLKRSYLFFIFLFSFALLTSCDNSSTNANEEINIYINDEKDAFGYLNSEYENEEMKISFEAPECRETTNFSLEVDFEIINLTNQTKEYEVKNFKIVRENSNVEYTVNSSLKTIKLEPELTENFKFSSTIPTSIRNDNYKLILEINNYKITYFLYNKPDELRENKTISFIVDNKIVKSLIVKENKAISENFIYESSDNLYYCDEWYSDQNCKNKFTMSTLIKDDIKLYGKLKSCFNWTTYGDGITILNKVEHTFSNGTLVIPRKYLNNDIYLNSNAIKDLKVNKIYIPKNIKRIYSGNFKNINGAPIYFEGSAEEWEALFYFGNPVTTNVRYNIKYPN